MTLTDQQSKLYHSHTIRNEEEILKSEICGCIACGSIYKTDLIEDWLTEPEDRRKTAICAKCGVDAVIGDSCGFELNQKILHILNKRWF